MTILFNNLSQFHTIPFIPMISLCFSFSFPIAEAFAVHFPGAPPRGLGGRLGAVQRHPGGEGLRGELPGGLPGGQGWGDGGGWGPNMGKNMADSTMLGD